MHEMALTQSVVDAVCEHAAGRHVQSVKVEIGALCAVVPDAMQFCFELATEGTVADGARLDLNVQPGSARGRSCGDSFELHDLILLCPCGSADVEVLAGRDLRILSMEVSLACAQPAAAVTTKQPSRWPVMTIHTTTTTRMPIPRRSRWSRRCSRKTI